jgi:hypothetical protein
MPGAESIASHGRTKKVSLLSIGSLGRLQKIVTGIIVLGTTEIINLISIVRTIMTLESRVDDT